MKTLRIGSGAGYSGDRIEPAVELAEKGALDYLVFECLAERTIAIAQQARLADPEAGFDPLLEARMRAVLPAARRGGIRIITNMGAANPQAAARRVAALAAEMGLGPLRVAAVSGDEIRAVVLAEALPLLETGAPAAALGAEVVSANAYLGAAPIVEALAAGADVVITGRVSDPALFLAPQIHAFGWAMDDWDRLARGTCAGHLLECAGQVTGGYFADPGLKDIDGLARLGFPIGEITADGEITLTKVAGSGGAVTAATVKEQLLYEVHDPAAYLTPDVVADFSAVTVRETGPDRVAISGARGRPAPATLKASVGIAEGWIGEGQISYAGPGARARAELAREIVKARLALTGVALQELRCDLIGIDAIDAGTLDRGGLAGGGPAGGAGPSEVRLRIAGRCASAEEARRIGREVETLYTNGPAGGGGATAGLRQVMAMYSTLVPRERAVPVVEMVEVTDAAA